MMKIVADKAIPFLRGVLEKWAEVKYLAGVEITPDDVRDADALIIRTRTRCNAALLEGSKVRFIATATIGFDHIDLEWCALHGIEVRTSAGCNARGVLQWVGAVLACLSHREGWSPREKTLGVVGVGHVGSLVAEYARAWGFEVVACDPPREEREHVGFLPLEEVAARADILTFHTPYDASTRHLVDERLLGMLRPGATVLNSSRGGVADNEAMCRMGGRYVLDVWEHEPRINRELLDMALLATPHIAGYSEQGKAVATSMAVMQLAEYFHLPVGEWYPHEAARPCPAPIAWEEMCRRIGDYYDIEAESLRLKHDPSLFEQMRDNYAYRREFF